MNNYQTFLEKYSEYGIVREVAHPVVFVSGLPSAFPGEVVYFENDQKGKVLSLREDGVEILLFTRKAVKKGTKVAKTGKPLSIPVGEYLLGMVIDPLGKLMTPGEGITLVKEERSVDIPPLKIMDRAVITEPFDTGVSMVDLLLPLGKGQRQIVTGDRKTGKTSFILSAIKTQVLTGSVVVYAAVGKKAIEIEQLRQFFMEQELMSSVVLIAASSLDSQSLVYTAPFSAMAVAEYLRDSGKNVFVVFDDLSTHAKFYREISLLGQKFPGRDSYPGDIFFTHARLLERAGNYVHPTVGEASITCLPLAETIENDLTDYIVSNLISITDGHLLFDSNEFVKGRRPAINSGLSVTRVGKQTRTVLHQDINQRLTEFLSNFTKIEKFSHFGSELTVEVKQTLNRGEKLYSFFYQPVNVSVPIDVQYLMVAMIWLDWLAQIPSSDISVIRSKLITQYLQDQNFQQLIKQIVSVVAFDDLLDSVKDHRDAIIPSLGINFSEADQDLFIGPKPVEAANSNSESTKTSKAVSQRDNEEKTGGNNQV